MCARVIFDPLIIKFIYSKTVGFKLNFIRADSKKISVRIIVITHFPALGIFLLIGEKN